MVVIAIGNGGCNVADSLCRIFPSNGSYRLVMLDTDSEQLGKHKAECEKVVMAGVHADCEAAIDRLLAGGDVGEVAVVVCLGGKAGSWLAPLVVHKASEVKASVKCVAVMPFVFEGESRRARAEAALSEIRGCVGEVVVLHNDSLIDNYADCNICDALLQIDREAANYVIANVFF